MGFSKRAFKDPKLRARREYLKKVFGLGRVYFVQRPGGLIKIGFTTNLKNRFRELQLTEHPDIVLLGSVQASRRYEKRLHKMFGFCWSHKEWFGPAELLKFYIEVLSTPANQPYNKANATDANTAALDNS